MQPRIRGPFTSWEARVRCLVCNFAPSVCTRRVPLLNLHRLPPLAASDAGNATFFYYPVSNTWTQYPDLPVSFVAPDICSVGGYLNLFGGSGSFGFSNLLLAISTTNPSAGWLQVPINNAPSGRDGHRLVGFGGVMYLFGGWDSTIGYYNDVWALDVPGLFNASGPQPGWVQVTANGTAALPPPRDGFSWDNYGSSVVLFGGFSHNVNAVGPDTCDNPNLACTWYNDVWFFRPVPIGLSGTVGIQTDPTAARWYKITTSGTPPTGRTGEDCGVVA